jgi:uncharacterized protein (TIGR01244 family)
MERFGNGRVFGAALLVGIIWVVSTTAYSKYSTDTASEALRKTASMKQLTDGISVSEQIKLGQIKDVRQSGFATIIDLRPDGEAAGQPHAATVQSAASAYKLAFVYVPVPHGDIPDSAVEALAKAIDESPKPILMYCRSGRRAARTWALVEASTRDGMGAPQILAAVKASGQTADDLAGAIDARIAKRNPPQLRPM